MQFKAVALLTLKEDRRPHSLVRQVMQRLVKFQYMCMSFWQCNIISWLEQVLHCWSGTGSPAARDGALLQVQVDRLQVKKYQCNEGCDRWVEAHALTEDSLGIWEAGQVIIGGLPFSPKCINFCLQLLLHLGVASQLIQSI